MNFSNKLDFLKSALELEQSKHTLAELRDWIKAQNKKVQVTVNKIPFDELDHWKFDDSKSVLGHETGKFFTIEGIKVKTNWGFVPEWSQPIINQPEIGYLGFITKEINGILHFLLQAKIEPGNVNHVQLSPTLQATKSNYTRAHKGKAPNYLEYFVNAKNDQILLDQLQSEQGARFLKKRNRNIIIKVDEEIELLDNFIWATLGQLKALMAHDNVVNMDTRTVISGVTYGDFTKEQLNSSSINEIIDNHLTDNKFLRSTLQRDHYFLDDDQIIKYITSQKCKYELEIDKIPLHDLKDWRIEKEVIRHKDYKYFQVIAVEVSIDNREVIKWTQPMIEPAQEGLCAFVAKEINGILHFAVQTKLECGNFDIIEFAPTVQCLTGNYRKTAEGNLPFLDYVLNVPKGQIVYDTMQSEEGGRFYKEQNRNLIILAGEEIGTDLPDNYIWMTINQMQNFIKHNNYINIQARNLLSALTFH